MALRSSSTWRGYRGLSCRNSPDFSQAAVRSAMGVLQGLSSESAKAHICPRSNTQHLGNSELLTKRFGHFYEGRIEPAFLKRHERTLSHIFLKTISEEIVRAEGKPALEGQDGVCDHRGW